jgi:gluconolactonase
MRVKYQRLSFIVAVLVAAAAAGGPLPSIDGGGRIHRLDPRFDALVPSDARLEIVVDGLEWAEGPVWDARDGSLLFSDVPRNEVLRWKPDAGVSTFLRRSGYTGVAPFRGREPGSNGLAFDREGRLVLCQHGDRRIVRREHNGAITVIADRFQGKRLNSPNDLVFRSNGDLYFTDPPFGLPQSFADGDKQQPFQGVYRVRPNGEISVVATDLRAPNGLAFSHDESTLYVANADPAAPVWTAYAVNADGTLRRGRQFADALAWVTPGDGLPDGLKVDSRGNVFATGPGGIHVFAPDGTRLGRIETGVPTGNLAWGEDGTVLFIAANHVIYRLRTTTRGSDYM